MPDIFFYRLLSNFNKKTGNSLRVVTLITRGKNSLTLFLLALIFLGGNAVANENDEVGSVTPIVTDEGVYLGYPDEDEGETKHRSRFPEHPELYQPMPIPDKTKKPPKPSTGDPEVPDSHTIESE